jgi:TetR/AcrR family transcriptional regulator, cholesterol catabolism regulator
LFSKIIFVFLQLLKQKEFIISFKKKEIQEVAAKLFRQYGYNACSMRQLAEAVGMEAASLYNHFKGKSAILEAICIDVAETCNEHLAITMSSQEKAIEQLETIIRFHVQMMINNFDNYFVLINDWSNLDEPALSHYVNDRKAYSQKIESIVAMGTETGELLNVSPYVVVLNIISAIRGLEFWHKSRKLIDARTIENEMVKHLLYGIVKS